MRRWRLPSGMARDCEKGMNDSDEEGDEGGDEETVAVEAAESSEASRGADSEPPPGIVRPRSMCDDEVVLLSRLLLAFLPLCCGCWCPGRSGDENRSGMLWPSRSSRWLPAL